MRRLSRHILLLVFLLPLANGALLTAQINTDRMMLMGRNALYYEDYVLAIQRFNMVVNAKPWLAEPYFYRALAKYYLEDHQGAEIDCDNAVERNPYMAEYFVLRAFCRINRQRYELAEADYAKALGINPDDHNSWHNMVICQMELKEYERADSALDKMIQKWPKEAKEYTMKAQVAFSRGDSITAEKWVDQAIETKKYAFVADYIRFYALYNYGGIYLDSDVEVLKSFDNLLNLRYFIGKEKDSRGGIEAARLYDRN